MINHANAVLDDVSVHLVGNKTNGDEIVVTKSPLDISDPVMSDLLLRFFLSPFKQSELFNFTFSNGDAQMNPVFVYAKQLFGYHGDFHIQSVNIAKHLYETSIHPQIKGGDFFVARISGLELEYKRVNAIGLFKSENRQAFLKLQHDKKHFTMDVLEGINPDKLDKGCIIFDTDEDKGYKVAIFDRLNKSGEAQFWKDQFLMLKPCSDEFHHTSDFLDIARQYVTKQLPEDFEVNKSDQIDILNRSMEYFKTRDNFEKKEFEQEVFQDEALIKSFRKFDTAYRKENEISPEDSFEISLPALKKQARVFKSILKLDKNFHIYIHGNKDLIEHGVEKDGRKFYKIYYNEEH